jgi:HD-GYP domain-containing protein (c-di-GMP phosphodiesterase class II)
LRLVTVHSLALGATLGKDVIVDAQGGIPLLRAGVAVTERFKKALVDHDIPSVWIEDDLSEGIEAVPVISDETRRVTQTAVAKAMREASTAIATGGKLSEKAIEDLAEVAALISAEVAAAPDLAMHLAGIMGADQYLFEHSVDVTALGLLIARREFQLNGWVDYQGKRRYENADGRLAKLGLGLLLHDIGKTAIDSAVLNKPGKLNEEEWAQIRRHPVVGADMLSEATSFIIKAVVRQHHERFDGEGYPDGIAGERIHQFARIATVADVYDAVTSERAYKAADSPAVGYDVILRGTGAAFDPAIVETFQKVVVPYPPGHEVTLADGRTGVVVDAPLETPLAPTVRVRTQRGAVEEIVGADIACPAGRRQAA